MSTCDSSVARRVMLKDKNWKFAWPKPHSELWVDNYVITKSASNVDQAYSFIEYNLQPAAQAAVDEHHRLRLPVPEAVGEGQGVAPQDLVFPPPSVLEYLESSVIYSDLQPKLTTLWAQVKAAL